ncbi:hypothetical protein OXE08_004521 [Salmonella enterica]|nr:hypothetical protein [Salmonella enterica]
MGLLDTLFKDDDQTLNFAGSDYKPTQSNVLGDQLAPTTPQGDLASVDPDNDNRSALQFKTDAQEAQKDASNAPDEDNNKFISESGNKYDDVPNSTLHQGLAAAANYLTAYFATDGNVGKAAYAAGQAVSDQDAKAHRLSQVNDLEKKGYNPMDIQNWINSGDKKDLVTNKGTWQSGGNGVIFNNLTAETRQIQGANNSYAPVKTEKLGNGDIVEYWKDKAPTVRSAGTGNSSINGGNIQTPTGGSNGLSGGSLDAQEGNTVDHVGFATNKSNAPISANVNDSNGNPLYMAPGGGYADYNGNRYTGQTTTLNGSQVAAQSHKESEADTQIQAVATQAGEGAQAGLDLLKMPGLNLAGPHWNNSIAQLKDAKFGANNFNALKVAADNYNHKLQQLGQAALYTESGGKRIFAEEMQTAGRNYIQIDPENMNAKQINDAVLHNNAITSRFQQYAKSSAAGQARPNASQTQYGQHFAAPSPSATRPGQAPGNAPAGAIQALQQNPALRDQFQAKYGYLPEGF